MAIACLWSEILLFDLFRAGRGGQGEFGFGVARPCAAAAPENGPIHALICRKRRIIPAHHANAAWPYLGLIHPSAGAKASASPGPHVPGAYL